MDSVTTGAVLLAIISGAGTQLGTQLWEGIVSLVRRPFRRNASESEAATAVVPSGEVELTALQHAPDDRQKAVALAQALLDRSAADEEFRQALESWWQQAEPIRASLNTGNVANTISGGTQHGPVLQGRDFMNITFRSPSSMPPVPPS